MSFSFRASTWNLLADAYIKPDRYPRCTPDDLNPTLRHALVLDTITSWGADVMLLQEVGPLMFCAIRERLGVDYKGLYVQKPAREDGLAVFVRKAMFHVETHTHLRYDAQGNGQQALIVLCQHQDQEQTLAFVSTHLTWQPRQTPADTHIGRRQLVELLDARSVLAPHASAWLIGGDLNAGIQSCVLEDALQRGVEISCRSQRPWDTVNINGRRRKLDFLLRTENLKPSPVPLGVQLGHSEPVMPMAGRFASDHLPVVVDYVWSFEEHSAKLQ